MRYRIAATLAFTLTLYAKRTADDVPPIYAHRLACSLLTLTLLASPILIGLVFAAATTGTDSRTRMVRAIIVALACVFAGAAIAATDARNDELWNPVLFGTPFLAASLPLGLYQALPRGDRSRVQATILSGLFAPLIAGFIYLLGTGLAAYLYQRGWPTSW